MKYRAIFLDMDHTLCDTAMADHLGLFDFQKALEVDFSPSRAEIIGSAYLQAIYGKYKDHRQWQKESGEDELGFRARLLALTLEKQCTCHLPDSRLREYAGLLMELRIKHFDFFPGVAAMLKQLRQRYTLVVVSNGPLFSQQPKIDKIDLAAHVNHIILGGRLEHQKPHPSIFQLACDMAGCGPAEALHVGDLLHSDILGAHNAGITSVWLCPEPPQSPPEPKPDHTIGSILELAPLIARLNSH